MPPCEARDVMLRPGRTLLWVVALLASVLAWLPLASAPTVDAPPVLTEGPPPALIVSPAVANVPDTIEGLEAQIAEVLRREGVPGVGLALVDADGVTWAGGVGVADDASGRPVDEHTVFRVASITKSIVGLGVMRLHEQGALDLDQPLHEALPELPLDNRWSEQSPVTLAHALEHTAGFDDMHFNEYFTENEATTPAEALAINPRSRVVRWRPGSRMSYSNVGYSVAALAIERATGTRFDAWLRDQVLRPIGMGDAAFARTPALRERLATGYVQPGTPAAFRPISHRAAGALLATPRQLGQLVHFWLTRGQDYPQVVSAAGFDRIETMGTGWIGPTDASYGLGNYGDVAHPVLGRGHDGGLPGFLSCYRYFPELSVGYVMLLNATHSPRAYIEIRSLLFRYITRDRTLPPPPRIAPDPERQRHAGFYGFANPRHSLLGFVERALLGWNATVHARGLSLEDLMGQGAQIVPAGDGAYKLAGQGGSSIRFGRDADGERVMVAGGAYAEEGSWMLALWRVRLLTAASLLLQIAPLWCVGWIASTVARRRRWTEVGVVVWPAVAGLCFAAMPMLLQAAAARDALGIVDPTTVALCAATIAFALSSVAGLWAALRASTAVGRTPMWSRVVPSLASTAAVGMTVWFGANGIIGLRLWAW